MNKRNSGILMHISSLPSSYSIGNFGEAAYRAVDVFSACGFSYWQVLPFCMTDECNSPYKSVSAFAGNPYFIDPEKLYEKGLITLYELEEAKEHSPYLCEFSRLREEREVLLRTAAMRVGDRSEIIDFVNADPRLSRTCRFLALRDANGGREWQLWETDKYDTDTLFYHQFVQYEFLTQWQSLKAYANSQGIRIIGDLPIYVAADSCEVWANPELFLLDKRNRPTSVAGVPPDYFAKDGQLWGNPIYNYNKMKLDGYKWWRDRIDFALSLFDGVRIDHFRGFEAYWQIPATAKTAKEGKWVKGPGRKIIDAIKEVAGDRLIIAEDLGDITDGVRKLLSYSGFPGMRVFQFGFEDGSDSVHLPHNYPVNSVAYTGTHDNNTLLGYVFELDGDRRRRVLEYAGAEGKSFEQGCDCIIRTVMASAAQTVILPVQDVLCFGADTRMNTPGSTLSNWAYRITKEQLMSIPKEKLSRLNSLYFRANKN